MHIEFIIIGSMPDFEIISVSQQEDQNLNLIYTY